MAVWMLDTYARLGAFYPSGTDRIRIARDFRRHPEIVPVCPQDVLDGRV